MTLLSRHRALPTACGVGSLSQLFGVITALRYSGVGVLSEMSVVSFDEDECLAFLDVPSPAWPCRWPSWAVPP